MAIKNQTAGVEPALRPLLGAGERLFAASPLVKHAVSIQDIADDVHTNSLDPALLIALGGVSTGAAHDAVFGRAVTGAPGSMARELFDLVGTVAQPRLAVTDRRLLVVDVAAGSRTRRLGIFKPSGDVATHLHSVPRAAVLGAVPVPANAADPARFLLGFVDGSGCVLRCASSSLAESVVRAVGPPRPDDN